MFFADEFLYIHGSPTHLLSVHVADQRLLVGDIFFAHAASLRQTLYFARREFSGVSSWLLTLVSGSDQREMARPERFELPTLWFGSPDALIR